ncbi:hypothetical protein N7467_011188 [Penicillium canescens]|nr:hypothetical protein N7467_011188 [Penicillium canescens]
MAELIIVLDGEHYNPFCATHTPSIRPYEASYPAMSIWLVWDEWKAATINTLRDGETNQVVRRYIVFADEDDHMTNVLLSRIRDPESNLTRGIREP